ncbi:MAG: ADP-forming succinate--CoA ligase subunit beta [Planctomycetota bacterium]|nr:MAG: ADP-forming succinate--CoA ligase subunit beta [Planctomycetota bacterium]
MKVHEYQAKALFREAGIPVPEGVVVTSVDQAQAAYEQLGGELAVIKAQIHAGGRGKGGGVKLVRSVAEARQAADDILGMSLVTHQTGPEGQLVKTVLVEAGCSIAHEYYLGITLDRRLGKPVLMASTEGGVEIEIVAAATPEKILKAEINPLVGLEPWQGRTLAYGLGLPAGAIRPACAVFKQLVDMFLATDASLVEVNPLVLTPSDEIVALDGKVNFDSNGLFRHPDIVALRDVDEEDPREAEAAAAGLTYIALDGSIGCLVNGAGLAMGTMDTIKLAGGEPANFLDVGGVATAEQVTAAFKIILSDSNVKAILVNIFGGIMKCDVIAEGILAAAKEVGISLPLVVRLEGTNVDRGRELLESSELAIISASDLADAAAKAVEAAAAGSPA